MATRLTVRKSGGSVIVCLPKAVLETLHLHVGSVVNLSLQNNQIVLTPVREELTLEALLKGSPKKKLALSDEDKQWVREKSKGKEL